MMREPVDLRRAVKEEVGQDLADLTFTPAMRERVLAQLPKQKRSRLTWLYPASAAAAILLILVTSNGHLMQKASEQAPVAAESAKAKAPTAAPAPTPNPAANQAATSKGEPATGATPPAEQKATAEVQPKDSAGTTAAAQPDTRMQTLGVPGPAGPAPGFASTSFKATHVPVGPQLAAVSKENVVVTLADGAVTRVDQVGAPQWQLSLPASLQAEQIVATPNGKFVVSAGSTVLLLGPDGSTLESLQPAEPVLQIAAGMGDQLALVSEQAVFVRQTAGQPLTALATPNTYAAAFTTDGLLLLATPEGLGAYEPSGNRRWLVTGEGGPLLVSPDGKSILWGNALYDANGTQVSTLEPAPGVAAGGPGLLRWDGERLSGFTWDGKQAWTWTAPGYVASVLPGAGEEFWVILDTQEGAKVQKLKCATGRPVGKALTLPAIPQEAIAVQGRLYLRLPEGLTVLPL